MARKKRVVVDCSNDTGSQTGITSGHMMEFWKLAGLGLIDGEVMTWILGNHPKIREMAGIRWWEDYVIREQNLLRNFFGREFDLSLFRKILQQHGIQQVREWQNRGFEIHFLPDISMSQEDEYPGWKIKPRKWYYDQIAEGKILRRISGDQLKLVKQVKLDGKVILIDIRLKPVYNTGKQLFFQDTLVGRIVAKLREENKIARYEYGDQTSRFGISAQEWQDHIRSALTKEFGVETDQVRLETAIEANVIPQLFSRMSRKDDGKTNTWVWYEEYFEGTSYRLRGGGSGYGGLSDVDPDSVGNHWNGRAFRPVVVLS